MPPSPARSTDRAGAGFSRAYARHGLKAQDEYLAVANVARVRALRYRLNDGLNERRG